MANKRSKNNVLGSAPLRFRLRPNEVKEKTDIPDNFPAKKQIVRTKVRKKKIPESIRKNLSDKVLNEGLKNYLGEGKESTGNVTTIDRRTSARKGVLTRGAREMTEAQIKAINAK